jgi:hypothetical protein
LLQPGAKPLFASVDGAEGKKAEENDYDDDGDSGDETSTIYDK